ncbi:hypothetical protein MMAD_54790 (plasmid) [Mycolicibacterium madagascariense]|uniref:Uncharacterized protein n=1 Tax=Mycolicibacterium madagascariense TaxID=212765 RepID=A0A7I7XPW9_9MYCO|nr:hypothetical protein MMAD_54790 [Mycolicibacterium madagascariense]
MAPHPDQAARVRCSGRVAGRPASRRACTKFDGGDVRAGTRLGPGRHQNVGAGGKVGGAAELIGCRLRFRWRGRRGDGRGHRECGRGLAAVVCEVLDRQFGRCRGGRVVNEIVNHVGEVVEE